MLAGVGELHSGEYYYRRADDDEYLYLLLHRIGLLYLSSLTLTTYREFLLDSEMNREAKLSSP